MRNRLRVLPDGGLEIVDPRPEDLPLLRLIDPGFDPEKAHLPGFLRPGIRRCLSAAGRISKEELQSARLDRLWAAHGAARAMCESGFLVKRGRDEASLLDVKAEIARRLLTRCVLCAHRCGVDRRLSSAGRCRLGRGATVAERFVHVGEEPPINPSLVISLAACALRCRYCQQGDLLNPQKVEGEALTPSHWDLLSPSGARSLSFAGGNPDESLPAILDFLSAMPAGWNLPVVWNTHAFSSPETVSLLDGVVDVWLPDLKYGSEECARLWSEIEGYVPAARAAIGAMVRQEVPVIVRMLVLPGHVDCCHVPSVRFLRGLGARNLFVSIRGQYSPDHAIEPRDGEMARRPTEEEVRTVIEAASG